MADGASAVVHVLGPTPPSAVKRCCDCQVFGAVAVAGPNFRSVATPITFCQRTTSGPLEPCWIVGWLVPGDGPVAPAGIVGPIGAAAGGAVTTATMAAPCATAHDLGPTTPSAV